MSKLRLLLILFLLIINYSTSLSQINYGNEWINFSKKYIKIKVSAESIYHLTFSDIIASGITDGSTQIDPKYFQMFNKGKEAALYISGSDDNSFDHQDNIYFYGYPNNADLDKKMYSDIEYIPNTNINLFEDDNYYFLTYNNEKEGLRYSTPSNTISPININYILTKSRLDFKTSYYPGDYILETMSLSEYINGEGYMSPLLGRRESSSYNINTSGFINTPGVSPMLSFYVAGRSNSTVAGSSNNHHFQISHENTIICDTIFNGYKTIRKTKNINLTGEITTLNFHIVDDLSSDPNSQHTDYQAISYLEILYPRNLTLTNNTALRFNIPSQYISANLNFSGSSSNPILIDIKNNYTYNIINNNNTLSIPNIYNNNSDFYIFDLNNSISATYQKITFKGFNVADIKKAIIISNKNLSIGAENYLNHNQQIRNIPTLLTYTDDIYNEFYYGFHHPLALNNFIKWSIDKSNNLPQSLLLLGAGLTTPKNNLSADLVPTYGYPASDNMLGIFNNAKASSIAIGRVPAKTNDDIDIYLNKLKIYENLPNEIWRKKIVNVTGGRTETEYLQFKSYLKNLSNIAFNGNLGSYTVNFDKTVSEAVTENLTSGIISQTNNGTNLITFLGHGSASLTAVSLGTPPSLNNSDKPTNYLINGCSTGNAFSGSSSYAENMILARTGAISWIGTTSEGVGSYLSSFSNKFYNHWFVNSYDKSIAEGFRLGINDQTNSSDRLNMAHSRQYIFFGDPNITFFNPSLPDYRINAEKIYLSDRSQNAAQDNFNFNFIIENIGKVQKDSLNIKITRKIEEQNIEKTYFQTIKPILNTDTFSFSLPNTDLNVSGINLITIELDPNAKFNEINKLNNKAAQTFFLPGNGVHAIYPLKNSIVFGEVTLMGQPDNLFTKNEKYIFEIDTVNTFDSPLKATSGSLIADILPTWVPSVNFKENVVYFWRIAIDDQEKRWDTGSFTYLNENIYGQNISHFNQIISSAYTTNDIVLNKESNGFKFQKDLFSTTISSRGDDIPVSQQERRIRSNPLNAISYSPVEINPGMTMVSYDKEIKNKIISYPSPYNSIDGPFPINGYTGQYYWDTTNSVALDSLVSYINQLPKGSYVLGVNNYNCNFKDMPEYVKQAFRSIGLKEFEKVGLGEPYMFWGIKGAASGEAIEYTADYDSGIPAREQYFSYSHDLEYSVSSGYFITDKFGPAKKWKSADFSYQQREGDVQKIDIYAVDKNNQEYILSSNLSPNNIDLSFISAKDIPYLKFKVYIENKTYRTLPKLNHWKIFYEPLTEITFNPSYLQYFNAEKLSQGDSLKLSLGLSNISPFKSDSLQINIKLTDATYSSYTKEFSLKPISPFSNDTLQFSYPTNSLKGETNLQLSLKNKNYGDNYSFNNGITYNTNILADNSAPNIDILVDGRRIINGEIVSPAPIFTISSSDNNKHLLQSDTSLVEVYIKHSSNNTYQRYYYSQGLLKIQQTGTAENNNLIIQFTPEKLIDGNYTLKVISKDYLGNKSSNDFLLDFEVINESTLTNFYPYPNPVIDKMKFVFTLTGEKVPDKIKIQIMTQTGRIVREVLKEELGNLKIGNNISDFVWDCKDQFGDRLANGIYFYRVLIEDSSEKFKHRYTKGDSNFKNNIGKIYLLK
ncbi:C25 family cysteine peptidase [Pseudopedobacter beijingensis]|uniref:C25 family cysteine peptidase n=1 Tax=Pseudopedobacter beijingensis TaxID=1207056 RepID=A0ABW4II01_9SPHI